MEKKYTLLGLFVIVSSMLTLYFLKPFPGECRVPSSFLCYGLPITELILLILSFICGVYFVWVGVKEKKTNSTLDFGSYFLLVTLLVFLASMAFIVLAYTAEALQFLWLIGIGGIVTSVLGIIAGVIISVVGIVKNLLA